MNFGRINIDKFPCGTFVLINPPEAVAKAADKKLMKEAFNVAGVKTAKWWPLHEEVRDEDFPCVVKHRMGSRGTGVYLLKEPEDYSSFVRPRRSGEVQDNFILEKFHSYTREYRIHATPTHAFLCHRKGRKDGVPLEHRWKHSFETSVWFKEDNPNFQKPDNWNEIEAEACKAVASLGLDFGAVDVKTSKDGSKFFIIEVNSAPSLGEHTREAYLRQLPLIVEHVKNTRPRFIK